LDKHLKVDVEPFQIRVEGGGLYINGSLILTGREEELKTVKEKIVKVILDFRIRYMPF